MTDLDQPLAAIEAAYRLNYPKFLHVATAVTGDAELGADAVQEAFVRAIVRRHTFRGAGPVEAWLWRIVVNAARDVVASRRPVPVPELPEDLQPSGAAGDGSHVRAAVAALPERQRLVLFLRYFADLDYETIGLTLAITPGTVGATLNSTHAALRARIEEVQIG